MGDEKRIVNGYEIKPKADLREANLREADLRGADLRAADLTEADLRWADLTGAIGLLDPSEWVAANLERDPEGRGVIAYKAFGLQYDPPAHWRIEPGSVISEVVNPLPTVDCGSGVNVGTLAWVRRNADNRLPIWRCLIRWEWAFSVVVPYGTDGKFRCSKVELLGTVEGGGALDWRNGGECSGGTSRHHATKPDTQ